MRSVPNAHFGGELVRSNPLWEHTGTRRIAETLEILVKYDGHTHHQYEGIDYLRTFVDAGDEIAQVHSEAETEIGQSTEHKAQGHEDLGTHPLNYETVQEAAEAIDERAYAYDDTEARVGDTILGREARHGD